MKEVEKIEEREDISEKEKKDMKQNISLFKYIGETARSTYERGWEHVNDMEQLKLNSHMMKHVIAEHKGEALEDMEFSIRAVQFTR